MDLRQLRHFVTLVEQGGFVRAAHALHLTQPALSRSIRALEEEIGTPLIDRKRSGSTPTPAGQMLAVEAQAILRRVTTLRHNLVAHAAAEAGDVRFGMAPLPATLLLPDLLAGVTRAHPGVTLSASVAGAAELSEQLARDGIEFFVAARTMLGGHDGFATAPFVTLPQSLVVRTGHPLARRGAVMPADLAPYPLACVSPDFLDGAGGHRNPRLAGHDIAIQCDDYAVLLELTLRSDAIWIASRALADTRPRRLRVLALAFPLLPAAIEFVVVSHAGRTLTPPARRIIALARALAADAAAKATSRT